MILKRRLLKRRSQGKEPRIMLRRKHLKTITTVTGMTAMMLTTMKERMMLMKMEYPYVLSSAGSWTRL